MREVLVNAAKIAAIVVGGEIVVGVSKLAVGKKKSKKSETKKEEVETVEMTAEELTKEIAETLGVKVKVEADSNDTKEEKIPTFTVIKEK